MATWPIAQFDGGLSEGSRRGIEGAFKGGGGLDYRTDPDALSVARRLIKDSGTTITALPKWIVPYSTDIYVYDASGKLYKRTSGGTWSVIATISDSIGNGMGVFDNYLYIASNKGLHRYGPLSTSPELQTDFLKSVEHETISFSLTGSNTYTLPNAISETSANKKSFTATADNVAAIVVRVVSKGTGDITVTLHDSSDNLIISKKMLNADLGTNYTRFEFEGQGNITVGQTYHFHVTSSDGTGTVRVNTASDLSTAVYSVLQFFSPEDVDQYKDAWALGSQFNVAAAAATVPSQIVENSENKVEFIPDKTTQTAISLPILDNGTGDWTITVHNDKNETLATKTITNANLDEVCSYQKFEFSTPWTAIPGATYHFHVTSSNGTGSILSTTTNDFETIGYNTHYQILEDEDWHPMVFLPTAEAIVIGNGNFLARYDGLQYRTDGQFEGNERLQFAKEEKCRCLALVADYLAIGVTRGDSVGDDSFGRLYLWDGTSQNVNNFKDVGGEPQAMLAADDGLLYIWHGGNGMISVFGGDLTLVKRIPDIGENKTVEIYPGAVSNWNGIPHFGISGGTTTTLKRVVYEFGHIGKNYPMSLNATYPISTGVQTNAVKIGAILGLGPDKIYVGWEDNGTYGVDLIDTTSDQASATYESLVFGGTIYYEKRMTSVKLITKPLASGQSITVSCDFDRSGSFTEIGTASAVGETVHSIPFGQRFNEVQIKVTLTSANGEGPTILCITLYYKEERDEQQ